MDLGGSMNTKVATVILPSSAYFLQKCEFCNRLTEVWGKPWHCQQLSQINNAIDTLCWSILLDRGLLSPKGSIINLCPPISINHTLLSCFDVLKGRRFVWQQSYTPSLAPSVQGKIRKGEADCHRPLWTMSQTTRVFYVLSGRDVGWRKAVWLRPISQYGDNLMTLWITSFSKLLVQYSVCASSLSSPGHQHTQRTGKDTPS